MAKIVSQKETSIKVDIVKNIVSGNMKDVDDFCAKTQQAIDTMEMKVFKLKRDIPVEEFSDLSE